MTPPAYADVAPPATAPRAPARSLTLAVTEEEAEALMAVLLLAPLEGGRTGDAMERVLSKLAEVQRAFARQE